MLVIAVADQKAAIRVLCAEKLSIGGMIRSILEVEESSGLKKRSRTSKKLIWKRCREVDR